MSNGETSKHPILIVDDEPEVLFSLKGLLRREFELHTAETGNEALEILRQHPIHVIMTDQRMPEMSGVELTGRVKNEFPDAIRIIFTGYADIKAVIEAVNRGGLFRYITKPWDPDELVETLQAAAREHEAMVKRRHLLNDLREHLVRSQHLANRLAERETGAEAEEFKELVHSTEQLLGRLNL